jgi:hypothetical protein
MLPLGLLVLALAGCTASYRIDDISGAQQVQLDPTHPVYVAVPQDGVYGRTVYGGSGQIAAQSISLAFSRHATRIVTAERHVSREQALADARNMGAKYLVWPNITHWEQRATEWSGRPSRMALRIAIVDTENGDQILSTVIEGRSRIMSMTSTSPESLLRDPLANYAQGLYR